MRLLVLLLLVQGGGTPLHGVPDSVLPRVPPPAPADNEPTALACRFESALRGDSCTYEAAAGPGEAKENSRIAAEAAARECGRASNADADLRKECERAVAEISLSAKCARGARLADADGRLTPDAIDCVGALGAVLRRTLVAAAHSLECCACLARARCSVAPAQCKRELSDFNAGAALLACIRKSSCDSCSFTTPAKAPEPLPPDDPKHPSKI